MKINKIKFIRNIILILLLLGCVFGFFANRYIKTRGFDHLGDFISNYYSNKKLIDGSTPESLKIKTSEKDFKFIEEKREEALARGIQINEGDNYVNCQVISKGDTINGEMRLKGHMTDHLEGEKWSFRVKTETEVMGMYRFSLQNPGTRNYAYEWLYHQLLAQEGIIHLKYDFIHLQLNEKDLGIYAIEEHFGQHIPRDNNRPPGAILRWNPTLYWEGRINQLENIHTDFGYTDFSTTFAEAYDKGVVKDDKDLIETYQKGATLLEEFRRGTKKTSDVFDMEKMAKFHAIIDLVGGYHSLDWSDVKFYYNSDSELIEPVGYESFSVRETHKIAGQRTPEDYYSLGFNYHDLLFSDPAFFAIYIKNLQRICSAAYVNEFENKIRPALNKKLGVIAREYAYTKLSFKNYYKNVELINDNLNLPKAFHAFVEEATDSTVSISVTPVCDFPIEILTLIDNGKDEYPITSTFTLPPKPRNTFAKYYLINFSHSEKKLKNLELKAKIPGSDQVFKVPVMDLPAYNSVKISPADTTSIIDQNSSVLIQNGENFLLREKETTISELIVIAPGQKLFIEEGQKLTFEAGGGIIVHGEIYFLGTSEDEIFVKIKPDNHEAIKLTNGKFFGSHTNFITNNDCTITSLKGVVNVQNCYIAGQTENFIKAQHSEITLNKIAFGEIASIGHYDRCTVRMKQVTGQKGERMIKIDGSDLTIANSYFRDFEKLVEANYNSICKIRQSQLINVEESFLLDNNSYLSAIACEIKDCNKGISVDLNSRLPGKSDYLLYKPKGSFKIQELKI